jgi:AcrR family transcriptional regulator
MSRKRFENLDPDKQERLFDSAADEFGQKGYDAASLNRILARSGMSKSSLYYYFEDKADLFTTMIERAIGLLFKEIGGFDLEKLTAETYWGAFEDLFRRVMVVMNKNAWWWVKLGRIFYRLRGDPKGSAPTGRTFQTVRRWTGLSLARGQELGVVRTDLPDSLLIDSVVGLGEAMDRWTVEHWDELGDAERQGIMVTQSIDLFRRLLAPPADQKPAASRKAREEVDLDA